MIKKKYYKLSEAKKYLNKKGLELFKKSYKVKSDKSFKNFVNTCFFGFVIIIVFSLTPKIIIVKNDFLFSSTEIENNSKNNLEKVLTGKEIKKAEQDDELDNLDIFQDIFEYEEISSATVRLSASTIEQLFKDTNYNLKDVRKNSVVKPINLTNLPKDMKMIENTKKRKNLFIKIVLPLILEENNQIKFDRKKLFSILNKNNNSEEEKKWLKMKFKQYGVKNRDLSTLKIRMDEVPISLAIAQAAKETGWGTSRFAQEGNALFGQWTFSGAGIKPLNVEANETHKVMRFQILQASIRAYHRNLNTHSSYKKFRKLRAEARDNEEVLDSLILVDCLDKYAATGKEYTKILKQIIKQNSLKDFDDAKLLPTSKKLKSTI